MRLGLSTAKSGAKQCRVVLVSDICYSGRNSLLGGIVPAQQRANVVLDNPLAQLSDSIQSIAARVSPAIVQIEVLGYIHPDDDKSDEKDRITLT